MILRFVWPPEVLAVTLLLLGGTAVAALLRSRREGDGRQAAWWRRLGIVLATVGIGATPAALAGTEQVVTNVEVFIVVDRTGSMAAEDFAGGAPRLEGVRADVVALTRAFPGARFSILAFDSQAMRTLPLTTDARAVVTWAKTFTQEVTAFSGGTAIDRPAGLLRTTLGTAAERAPQDVRLVFFLSDGENTDGNLSSADAGLQEYAGISPLIDGGAVLGYGTQAGGRMRSWDGRDDPQRPYIVDPTRPGQPDAVSRIDEENLRELAGLLGVGYEHRTAVTELDHLAAGIDLDTIVADGRDEVEVHRDVYWPLVWVLVALLAWEAHDQVRTLRQVRGLRARA